MCSSDLAGHRGLPDAHHREAAEWADRSATWAAAEAEWTDPTPRWAAEAAECRGDRAAARAEPQRHRAREGAVRREARWAEQEAAAQGAVPRPTATDC